MVRAIVVIEMLVETIEGKFKLNQHKIDADHVASRHGFRRRTIPPRRRSPRAWSRCGRI